MTISTAAIADLVVSPYNVRTNAEDADATEALEASIVEIGLLLPLIVHSMPDDGAPAGDNPRQYGVLAGGRRLRALQRLVESGCLAATSTVPIVVRDLDPAKITELSLAENLLRRDLRPYEVHAAVARATAQGAEIEEIAANIGQRVEWVRRQLRLGRLVPEIFEAYAGGALSLDEAQAFAGTEDQELQRAAWAHFGSVKSWQRDPAKIRAWYKIGDRELDRLLRFVGAQAYRDAGGRFELDLFADGPERGRVVDQGTLREMAEHKLGAARQDLRRCTGRPDLRFISEPPQHLGSTDHTLEITPKPGKAGAIGLPAGDVVATVVIDADGGIDHHFWWPSRKAKREGTRQAGKGGVPAPEVTAGGAKVTGAEAFDRYSAYSQAARAAVKDEHGLTADGLQVMRSVRRELLRALLVANALEDGTVARDYLVWAQLRQELGKTKRDADVGARGVVSTWQSREDAEPIDAVTPHLEEMKAHRLWTLTVQNMAEQPFIVVEDPAEAFTIFHLSADRVKSTAAAVMAGLALLRSANVPGWRIPAHDRLAEIIGADDETLRELWQPTGKFMALFPKMKRLELAQPHVEAEAFRDWHKLSDPVLTSAVAGAVEQVPGWVHPLLSFGVASEHSAEQREAAE